MGFQNNARKDATTIYEILESTCHFNQNNSTCNIGSAVNNYNAPIKIEAPRMIRNVSPEPSPEPTSYGPSRRRGISSGSSLSSSSLSSSSSHRLSRKSRSSQRASFRTPRKQIPSRSSSSSSSSPAYHPYNNNAEFQSFIIPRN